jgi:hypothetical protein
MAAEEATLQGADLMSNRSIEAADLGHRVHL